jgi:hypothetical protein
MEDEMFIRRFPLAIHSQDRTNIPKQYISGKESATDGLRTFIPGMGRNILFLESHWKNLCHG